MFISFTRLLDNNAHLSDIQTHYIQHNYITIELHLCILAEHVGQYHGSEGYNEKISLEIVTNQ